ncbi:hypothetical protein N5P18_15690 [Janibacter terrae]|uniref:Phage gp6-like head-tail connector protein n=1 Tax=Janibacter terrae TaxID=103817 RepID=A0ABZ2FED5_9MICO
MALPLVSDVLAFLGQPAGAGGDPQIQSHLDATTAMVRAYVRDNGFLDGDPADDLAAVIVSSAARSYRNPTHDKDQTAGPFTHTPGLFNGWTLPELAVLHRYRTRAQ